MIELDPDGSPRTVLVIGASGFIGREVVSALNRAGRPVRAMCRTPPNDRPSDGVSWFSGDICDRDQVRRAASGVDAVVHVASAGKGSDDPVSARINATRTLLEALDPPPPRFVHVSSIAVYDATLISEHETVDESSPMLEANSNRGRYATAKREEERLVADYAVGHGASVVTLRPGIVFGPDRLWTSHLGSAPKRGIELRVISHATVPVTYVVNCAEAIAMAVDAPTEASSGGHLVVNVVDDHPPSQEAYRSAISPFLPAARLTLRVPVSVIRRSAEIVAWLTRRTGRVPTWLPDLLRTAEVRARFQPMTYSTDAAARLLGWKPRYTFGQALAHMVNQQ